MDVSSGSTIAGDIQVDTMKKSMDIQERQVLKVLENVDEVSKQNTAQKTGLGVNLNITG